MADGWVTVVRHLEAITSGPTREQRALAKHVGVTIPRGTPRLVAGALLRSALRETLGLERGVDPHEDTVEYLRERARDAGVVLGAFTSRAEFDAWMQHVYALNRLRAHRALQLAKGDIVRRRDGRQSLHLVSSVGLTGAVFFEGRGLRAWPDQLELVCRAGDTGKKAVESRRHAKNHVAATKRTGDWSTVKHAELEAFLCADNPSETDIAGLVQTIDDATDEKSIQLFLQERPHLLAPLLRGPVRYVLPQVHLGLHYVADFLLAEVDSLGVRWTLVELERPNSAVTLVKGNHLDMYARKGVAQVHEWRSWLEQNIATAQLPKARNGNGLPDISSRAPGLVLVGRRAALLGQAAQVRRQVGQDQQIKIHTYDWLVEAIQGSVAFHGPPSANPFLLGRPVALDDEDDDGWLSGAS